MNGMLRIRGILSALLIFFMAVLYSACGDGNGPDPVPNPRPGSEVLTLGSWSGNGVSFTLNEGSYLISDLSVTYSGRATGTICSFNYTRTETMGTDIPVEFDAATNNWIFSYDSPDLTFYDSSDLTIEGVFTSGTSAELELTWSFYDDVCDATVTGSDVLYADHGDGLSPPVAGDWNGPSGFGEIELVVSPDSTAIESIVIRFIDFTCGNVTSNGSITITSSWPISNGQFSADIDIAGDRTMNITGTFDDSGTYVSGTYEADYDGTICDGTWDALPENGDNNSDDHGDAPSSATALQTNGTKVSGEIQAKAGGDLDYFRFFATAGNTYTIETSDLEGGLDTVIVLYSTNGTTQINEDDDGADEPLASRIVWTCQVSGTYYVSVGPYAEGNTGRYNIAVSVGGQTPPVAGNWSGPSGFGEIELVVASNRTELESIVITFIDFSCAGVITNGTITRTGSWAISNGQFAANVDWTGTLVDGTMEIIGTFDDSGTSVSGTYIADYDGTLCDGTWDASPE